MICSTRFRKKTIEEKPAETQAIHDGRCPEAAPPRSPSDMMRQYAEQSRVASQKPHSICIARYADRCDAACPVRFSRPSQKTLAKPICPQTPAENRSFRKLHLKWRPRQASVTAIAPARRTCRHLSWSQKPKQQKQCRKASKAPVTAWISYRSLPWPPFSGVFFGGDSAEPMLRQCTPSRQPRKTDTIGWSHSRARVSAATRSRCLDSAFQHARRRT